MSLEVLRTVAAAMTIIAATMVAANWNARITVCGFALFIASSAGNHIRLQSFRVGLGTSSANNGGRLTEFLCPASATRLRRYRDLQGRKALKAKWDY
ncbi:MULTISPECIES: hypothetical protein [Bradyrhizobium]|uniref:hypothetical protein n=1 Tax=Bradyrhizobium TaxID=374 RepID=UPI00117EAB7E|nr:hypothetical protein [Bradyrhizobium japonicum]